MGTNIAVFPLGTVLFPGLVLPLHIFEDRYRTLVRDVTARPADAPREFGVVTLRHGLETAAAEGAAGAAPEPAEPTTAGVYEVGCTAEMRQVTELPDGRYDLVTLGRRRFRVLRLFRGAEPYLQAEVEWLTDDAADPGDAALAEALAPRVLAAFRGYLDLLRPDSDLLEDVPESPTVLSYLVAAGAQLTLDERHLLLAAPDTTTRLRTELKLLHREAGLLARVRAVPVPLTDLARPVSPN